MEKDLIKKDKQMAANYHRTNMQKETVLQRLKENGCRIRFFYRNGNCIPHDQSFGRNRCHQP